MSTKRQLVLKLMEEEEDLLLTAAYLQLQIMKKARRKRKKRSVWMRDWWLQRRVLYNVAKIEKTPRESTSNAAKFIYAGDQVLYTLLILSHPFLAAFDVLFSILQGIMSRRILATLFTFLECTNSCFSFF